MNSQFEQYLFTNLVDEMTDSFLIDFASQEDTASQVERLTEQCRNEGLSDGYISLARKAAAIQACSGVEAKRYD